MPSPTAGFRFKASLALACILLILLIVYLYNHLSVSKSYIVVSTPADKANVKDVIQDRIGVSKMIYAGPHRLDIVAKKGQMAMLPLNNDFKFVETMDQVVCLLQEKEEGDFTEKKLTLKAEKAFYDYKENVLIAEQVEAKYALFPLNMPFDESSFSELIWSLKGKHLELFVENAKEDNLNAVIDHGDITFMSDIELTSDYLEFKGASLSNTEEIVAKHNVKISYKDYLIESVRATYLMACKEIKGELLMDGMDTNTPCHLTSLVGDSIFAKEIRVNSLNGQLSLLEPTGTLISHKRQALLTFSSGTMLWDDFSHTLTLNHNVVIDQAEMGHFQSASEVKLQQGMAVGDGKWPDSKWPDSKWIVKTIEAASDTTAIYKKEKGKESEKSVFQEYVLSTKGKIKIDHEKMLTNFYSLVDESGNIPKGNQVKLDMGNVDVFSDHVLVKYGAIDGHMELEKMVMSGNVTICKRAALTPLVQIPFSQYLTAERAEYDPLKQEIVFFAKENKRVLFYDTSNQMEMSAPCIKATYDKETKKEIIKGIGDVRFRLINSNLRKL